MRTTSRCSPTTQSTAAKEAASAAGARAAYFAALKDGAIVCLCSAGGGHLLGVTGPGGAESACEIEVLQYGSDGSSVSQVDWADGAARLPTVTSESAWIVRVRDGLISFASCRYVGPVSVDIPRPVRARDSHRSSRHRPPHPHPTARRAGGRLLKAVKNATDAHALGGTSSSRQELWRIDEKEGALCSVAFPATTLGWEVVELKATPTAALRESERVQLREARKMRTQVQSAELRLRESDKKKRDSVATLQQEAESLQLLTDKQQCRIDELEGTLRQAQAQLHNSQTSVAELDRLVVQMAGEKQKAVQTVELEQQERIASLQAELADARAAHESRVNGILYEKKMLEDRNEEMIASLNQMNSTKDAELLELQEERLRLSATIRDIADRVGSVSPASAKGNAYKKDIESSPSFSSFRDDLPGPFPGGFDVDVSRTNAGGRRVGGPRGGSAAARLF